MTHFKLAAFGTAAVAALLITFMVGRSTPPPVANAADGKFNIFDEMADQATLKKADRFPVATLADEPRAVGTERVVPPSDAPAKPPVVLSREDERPAAKRAEKPERNICTRHHRRKVWINRYKWRCLK